MSKLYCITVKYRYDESVSYVAKRIGKDGSLYCLFIQYAVVSSDPEELKKKVDKLRERFPEEMQTAKIRPFTAAELASYGKETTEHFNYLERRKRQCNMTVIFEEENNTVVFYTKKNLNKADHAAFTLFRALGFQVGELKNGGKYAQRNLKFFSGEKK